MTGIDYLRVGYPAISLLFLMKEKTNVNGKICIEVFDPFPWIWYSLEVREGVDNPFLGQSPKLLTSPTHPMHLGLFGNRHRVFRSTFWTLELDLPLGV